MPWNPDQYDKFKRERSAPVDDLFALMNIRSGLSVIDLGCGTGEYTRRLFDTLPGSTVLGIDNSAEMLAKSAAFCCAGCSTQLRDLQTIDCEYDIIFSNAALQWCPEHPELFARIWKALKPGGQLLVQMPKNQDHYSHRLAAALSHEMFPTRFPDVAGERKGWLLEVEDYAQLLFTLGAVDITAILKVYPHVLENADAVVEWVKGTLLVPILSALTDSERENFLERYVHSLREAMPGSPVFYGFKRILLSAGKP